MVKQDKGLLVVKQNKGPLITLEGIDGSGKSTLAQKLYDYLRNKNYSVLLTKEPGATKLGATIRTLVNTKEPSIASKAELLLFAADRAQHFHEIVIPALNNKSIVISDRMADSSVAYQGFGRGLDKNFICCLNKHIMENYIPDLTFYLRLDYHTAYTRIQARKDALTSFDQEKYSFFNRVIDGFETIFADKSHVVILDGTQTQEEVFNTAVNYINKLIS